MSETRGHERDNSTAVSQEGVLPRIRGESSNMEVYVQADFCEMCKVGVQFYSSACGYPVFPAPFIEDNILSSLCVVGAFLQR